MLFFSEHEKVKYNCWCICFYLENYLYLVLISWKCYSWPWLLGGFSIIFQLFFLIKMHPKWSKLCYLISYTYENCTFFLFCACAISILQSWVGSRMRIGLLCTVLRGAFCFWIYEMLYILQENGSEKVERRIKMSFVKMSASFPDPAKAEQCFQKLHGLKNNSIFDSLAQLMDEVTIESGRITRVSSLLLLFPYFHPKEILSCSFVLDNLLSADLNFS